LSESTAKATRRQLRRVVGETAGAAFVEQSQLVVRHDRLLGQHGLLLSRHASSLLDTDAALTDLDTRVSQRHAELTWFLSMTFRERLVWVVTGRLPWV
jgi:hypothetical protein